MKRFNSIVTVITLLIVILAACSKTDKTTAPDELLTLGEKYLIEMDYEQAAVYFAKLIEVEPLNPRGYTGLAETFVSLGRREDAIEILRQGIDLIEDYAIRSMLDELTSQESSETPPELEKQSNNIDIMTSILSPKQLEFLESLETAILSMDYESALRLQAKSEFEEIYKAIPGWQEGMLLISDEVVYKMNEGREWYIKSNTVGPNGVNYGPSIGVWINGRNTGTNIHSFFPVQCSPIHVLITNVEYSGGKANGSYKRIYYDENSDYMVELGNVLDGLKHGEEIIETGDILVGTPYSLFSSSSGWSEDNRWICRYEYGKSIYFENPHPEYPHLYLGQIQFVDGTTGYSVCVDSKTMGETGAGYANEIELNLVNEIF